MTTKISSLRGRPRSFDRDQAIMVAQRLFHERGYDGVSVADLGMALGIKPPSFYSAFGSKAGLFAEVVDHYARTEGCFAPEALSTGGSVADGIERLLMAAARHYRRRGGKSGCLVLDATRNSGDIEARAITGGTSAAMRMMIVDHIAQSYPDRADELADLVVIAMKGMSAAARDNAGGEALENFAAMAARGFRQEAEGKAA